MLILQRKKGEAVDLIDRKTGTVLATVRVLEFLPGGCVRLGFDASQEVRIVRDNIKNATAPLPLDADGHAIPAREVDGNR